MAIEIFTTQSNYEIEQVTLHQKGKMCAPLGEYVKLSDYRLLQKESEWIPVGERLPEKDIIVDACSLNQDDPDDNYIYRTANISLDSNRSWVDINDCAINDPITHWMPRPKLPKSAK